jgi:hypothetical protein
VDLIQLGKWIRIGNLDPDPGKPKWSPKQKKKREFMFEELCGGPKTSPEV